MEFEGRTIELGELESLLGHVMRGNIGDSRWPL